MAFGSGVARGQDPSTAARDWVRRRLGGMRMCGACVITMRLSLRGLSSLVCLSVCVACVSRTTVRTKKLKKCSTFMSYQEK